MGRKKREITPEQQEYLSHLGINEDDRNGRYYRKDLADMQAILDSNGHETPNEADYQELRKQRKNDTEFKSSKNRIEQYFQYKADKGRQINMFDDETQEPRTDNKDLAGANETASTELDEQVSTDIQEAQTDSTQEAQSFTVNAPEDTKENNTVNEPENNSNGTNGTNNKKSGRKKIYGDREKLTLYISKELANAISYISKAKNISMSNYAVSILEQEISEKKELLEELFEVEEQKKALQEKL